MRTHALHVGYLVSGLVFLGIAAAWLLNQLDVIEASNTKWVAPAILLVAGIAGLLASVGKGLRGSRPAGPDSPEHPEPNPPVYHDETGAI